LLNLYKQCFPVEYTNSEPYLTSTSLTNYGSQESEFFDLLEDKWFPFMSPIEEEEIFSRMIVISPLSFDPFEVEPDSLDAVDVLGLALYDDVEWQTALNLLKVTEDVPTPIKSEEVEWEILKRVFTEASEPICHFLLAIKVLGRTTDNVFFDSSWEDQIGEYEWTMKDLTWLRDEFSKAEAIQTLIDQLNQWIQENPNRISTIVNLWNQCSPAQQLEIPLMPKIQIVPSSQLEKALTEQYDNTRSRNPRR